ncbi:hypothetical protein [Azospirillum endophyticum]
MVSPVSCPVRCGPCRKSLRRDCSNDRKSAAVCPCREIRTRKGRVPPCPASVVIRGG